MTLAAPKQILAKLDSECELYLADIGIPEAIYKDFGIGYPPFGKRQLLKFEFDKN